MCGRETESTLRRGHPPRPHHPRRGLRVPPLSGLPHNPAQDRRQDRQSPSLRLQRSGYPRAVQSDLRLRGGPGPDPRGPIRPAPQRSTPRGGSVAVRARGRGRADHRTVPGPSTPAPDRPVPVCRAQAGRGPAAHLGRRGRGRQASDGRTGLTPRDDQAEASHCADCPEAPTRACRRSGAVGLGVSSRLRHAAEWRGGTGVRDRAGRGCGGVREASAHAPEVLRV